MRLIVLGAGFTGKVLADAAREQYAGVVTTQRTASPESSALVWASPAPLPCEADHGVVLFPPRGLDPAAAAAPLSGLRRLVYVSATSVYGDRAGAEADESTPPNPTHPSAVARLAAEDAMRAVGAVVVRAGGIYGPGRNMVERHRAGQLRNAGDPDRPVNLIHVSDLTAIILACLERGVPGEVVLAVTGRPVSWRALAEVAVERTGRPLPGPTPVPEDPDLASFYTESKRLRPTTHERLGVTLRFPDSVAALRDVPLLAPSTDALQRG